MKNLTSPELKAAHHVLRKGGVVMGVDRIEALEFRILELEKQVKSQKGVLSRVSRAVKKLME